MSTPRIFDIAVAAGTDAADLLIRAREAARGAGISLAGDDKAGRFQGAASGTYTVDADARVVRVEVASKPSFVPWSLIENLLRKAFA